jgi:SET domain
MSEENGYQSGMQGCSPGIGAAINCDLPLVNVMDTWSKIDGGGLHRAKDPGAGAFTPYYDRKSRATRSLQAGEELFIDYGENYFKTRASVYGLMPMHADYKEANTFVKTYLSFRDKAFKTIPKYLINELEADLWSVITNWGFETRMLNALPRNHSDLEQIMAWGGTQWRHYKRSIRDMEWLEEHGQCMDNIKPGKSTIAQAGRGVFATRFIPKGGLVAPAPLIHIKDKKELVMYDVLPESKDGLIHRNASRPVHHQLLLNYCFGHRNSTVLLSPYGLLTSLINHSPNAANARITWTSPDKLRSPDWLKRHPDEWTMESHSGLQFDFVALRDIDANEEITIDYGPEWEAAWKEHVKTWQKPEGADKYIVSYEMQTDLDRDVPTEDEGGLGETMQVYCHEIFRQINGLEESDSDYHRCRAIKRYKNPSGETRYLVELYYVHDEDMKSSIVVSELLFDVPRSVFHFEDTSYTRDHQRPFSFRHEMMIPDDMFPAEWMNQPAIFMNDQTQSTS